jgi:2-hydroxy-6-oxo-6-(2'-aminophenyl)hexa-2,4-dienoate hydrolase
MAGAESCFVEAGGLRTHYYAAGRGGPVILLHGGGAGADSWGNWRDCVPELARRHTVYAVDMLGFGWSAQPDPSGFAYTQQARVDHIIAVLDALRLRAAAIIGNSMGGLTAMGVAVDRPDLVNRLVLMGSAGVRAPISDSLKSILDYDFTVAGMERIVRGLTHSDFVPDPALIEYRHRLSVRPETKAAYAATMQWQRDQGGLFYEESYMRRIEQKVLVINGKDDQVVPLSSGFRLVELIEPAWGYFIPRCGHWAMIERPADFLRATLAFLDA